VNGEITYSLERLLSAKIHILPLQKIETAFETSKRFMTDSKGLQYITRKPTLLHQFMMLFLVSNVPQVAKINISRCRLKKMHVTFKGASYITNLY
jgi:hypothetical protein